jgi:hypothetical protein
MHLHNRKMTQYYGFWNRLLELVRIFTTRLMMTRWRRLCIKFVGVDKIEREIHGNRSYIYRDMLAWWKCSRNHIKKMLRDWLLTVGVRQNQKKHILSKTLPNILSCVWKVLPHHCEVWLCFRRWLGIPASVWSEPNRARVPILQRTKQRMTCDITVPHTRFTVSGCGFVTKYQNTSNLENHYVEVGTDHKELVDRLTSMSTSRDKRGWDMNQMRGLNCLVHLSLLFSRQTRSLDVTSILSSDLEDIFDYWNDHLSGHTHVKRTYPDVVRMWRQFHGCPWIWRWDRVSLYYTCNTKHHDILKKNTMNKTLENTLKTGMNTK